MATRRVRLSPEELIILYKLSKRGTLQPLPTDDIARACFGPDLGPDKSRSANIRTIINVRLRSKIGLDAIVGFRPYGYQLFPDRITPKLI